MDNINVNEFAKEKEIYDVRLECLNGNGFVLGKPGTGKSIMVKKEIANIIKNTNDEVIVIEMESEYHKLAKYLNGEVIKICANQKNYINPFDVIPYVIGNHSVISPESEKMDEIMAILQQIIGDRYILTPSQMSVIARAMHELYKPYRNSETVVGSSYLYDDDKVPTLTDFIRFLENQKEKAAKELALALEFLTYEPFDMFAHTTNVSLYKRNRFTVYNLSEVGCNLKTLATTVVLGHVWNQVKLNHDKSVRTWVYIDDAYYLLNNEFLSYYTKTIYKRSRMVNGYFTFVTQDTEDVLANEDFKTMLANSEYNAFFGQSSADRNMLAKMFEIPEDSFELEVGNCLIAYHWQKHKKLKIELPQDKELLEAMSGRFY